MKSPSPEQKLLRVFLCHSSANKSKVRRLYERLCSDGLAPWLDEENLWPGQDWDVEILKAIRSCDVVIVCLSHAAVTKAGYVHKEIGKALDVAEEQPDDTIFIIPLKLEECEIPERLKRWHCVNFHQRGGYERLLSSLRIRANEIGASPPPSSKPASISKLKSRSKSQQLQNRRSEPDTISHNDESLPKSAIGKPTIASVRFLEHGRNAETYFVIAELSENGWRFYERSAWELIWHSIPATEELISKATAAYRCRA